MKPAALKKLKAILAKPKRIVIITHWSPDGDAMGSSLGLYNFLLKKKHKVSVITPNEAPSFLNWMPGTNKVIDFQKEPAKSAKLVASAELIFCLDFNSLSRIDKLGPMVENSAALKMMIDHHLEPDGFADYMHHSIKACSTCELIFTLIEMIGEKKLIDRKIANCLYTGIMTDTGSFRFPSTTAETHRVVAGLIEAGAENADIHNRIYDGSTESRLRLLGYCLSEKMVILKEYHTGYITLSDEEHKRFSYQKGDTEGLVNYILSLKGIKFAVFMSERDGMIKISFRSKGGFDVNTFARKHFTGGGHKNAAGGASNESLGDTVKKFTALVPKYKKELQDEKF
jgi:phosphoesterase RecJ-like protein